MDSLCLKCKGRNFCKKKCKWLEMDFKSFDFKRDLAGSSPSIFVGKANYPNVSVGAMSLPFNDLNAKNFDNPKFFKDNLSIAQIIKKRGLLVNCNSSKKSFLPKMQELALSIKPVDIEANLSKKPKAKMAFDFSAIAMGPSSEILKFSINENIKVDKNVQKCFDDSDLRANDALGILHKKGIGENDLSKYLSSAAFGIKKNRKLVPTRWSITAVDDSLGKQMIERIKSNKVIEEFMVFCGNLFGNYYTIILLPDAFGFELLETFNDIEFMHDYEGFYGRKEYAYDTAGGYYACRLAALEWLDKKKLQARIIAYRKITDEYLAPLGVWVVREASRNAMNNPIAFESIEKAGQFLGEKLFKGILKNSELLKNFLSQKKINDF